MSARVKKRGFKFFKLLVSECVEGEKREQCPTSCALLIEIHPSENANLYSLISAVPLRKASFKRILINMVSQR